MLKIVVELVTAEPEKSTIASGSRVCSRRSRCIVVGFQGIVFFNMSGVGIIFSIRIRVSSRAGGIGRRALAANCGKIN